MDKQILPICLCTDDNYALPTCVAIQSIKNKIANSKRAPRISIYIFYDNLTEENMNTISLLKSESFTIEFINISAYISNINFYTTNRFTQAMYYRFFIPEILSQYEKVMYIDCDIIINCPIYEYFDIDLADKALGVVYEYDSYFNSGVYGFDSYFNSGILVFNCKQYIKENIRQKCVEFIEKNKNLSYPDQDALNYVCKDLSKSLSREYNFFAHRCLQNDNYLSSFNIFSKIKAFHYTGIKPWRRPTIFWKRWWKETKKLPIGIKNKFRDEKIVKPKQNLIFSFLLNSILGLKICCKYKEKRSAK